jgi:cullin 1
VGKQAIQQVVKTAIKDPQQYVETVLKVYKQYNTLVVGSFRNDPGFVASLDKACRSFINENAVCKLAKSASKSPELLARFVDSLLKKSAKNPEEQEMEQLLTDVVRAALIPFPPLSLSPLMRAFMLPLHAWFALTDLLL